MKIGRCVAYVKTDGSYVIGCVKEVNSFSLIAVEPNGVETELAKGQAHRINSESLEAMVRKDCGIHLAGSPWPKSSEEEPVGEDGTDLDDIYDEGDEDE